jgi:hypothetical protein
MSEILEYVKGQKIRNKKLEKNLLSLINKMLLLKLKKLRN